MTPNTQTLTPMLHILWRHASLPHALNQWHLTLRGSIPHDLGVVPFSTLMRTNHYNVESWHVNALNPELVVHIPHLAPHTDDPRALHLCSLQMCVNPAQMSAVPHTR